MLARYLNDLALLRLVDDITWDDNKQPICFPKSPNDSYVGQEVTVAGWGWTKEPALGIYFLCFFLNFMNRDFFLE